MRDRHDDIPLLVQSFLEKLGPEQVPPRTDVVFSQAAMRRMMAFSWPGNIRQLKNLIERALALTPGRTQIDVSDLPHEVQQGEAAPPDADLVLPEEGIDLQRYLQDLERELIRRSLDRTAGNKHKAAQLLNIKRTTLIEKVKRLQL